MTAQDIVKIITCLILKEAIIMERKVRVVQYGAGKMSRYLMRYVIEHDGELVGAFCRNKNHIGKDVAEIIGNGFPTVGVKVEDSATADARIGELKPDVCIIATRSTVAELEDIFTICAKHGVNAITTCEEALYPWNSSPALTAKLDKLAKEGNCTLTGVGKIYNPEEIDRNVWTLHGEPETTCIVNQPATVELTCATLVNRIPQLIDAPAGYVTTDQFPYNEYMVHPMNEYVHSK